MKTETRAKHTAGAIRAAEIITQSKYGASKKTRTEYGQKTAIGIADLIDRQTHVLVLLAACEEATIQIKYLRDNLTPRKLRFTSTTTSLCLQTLKAAIAAAEGEP